MILGSKKQAGIGLIEVLLAAGIALGLMVAVSKYLLDVNRSSRKVESTLDLTSLRSHIMSNLSCANTIAATANCLTSNVDAEVRNASNGIIIPRSGTTMGRFFVRARCEDGASGGLAIRAVLLTAAGSADAAAKTYGAPSSPNSFVRDEMNANLLYDWNHPKGALFAVVRDADGSPLADKRLCRAEFGNPLASPTPMPTPGPTSTPPTPAVVSSCPTGSVPGGTDANGSLVCLTIPQLKALADSLSDFVSLNVANCGSGKAMKGIKDGEAQCVPLPAAVGATPGPAAAATRSWMLDRDCGPASLTDPSACSLCRALTVMTCPANPGGLPCAVSAGTKCVTPMGCRRFVCM